MIREHRNGKYLFLLVSAFLILSLLFSLPLMKQGVIYSGDDLSYHIARLNELYSNYKNGNFFVGISTFEFSKIGYPVNLFYPWVTLIPFIILRILTGKAIISIYLGISFYSFLTLFFTYICTLKISRNKLQSFVTATVYTFCAYRVIDIFSRFALGEFLALTFLPLVFYGFYAIMFGKNNDWPYLGLGLSFVMLSHILSTYISVFVLGIVFIILFYWVNDKKSCLLSLAKSIGLFVLSSAIFLFPFLEQERFQKFLPPSINPLHSTELTLSNLVLQSLNNNLNGALATSGSTYNIGIVLLIAIFIGFFQYKSWKLFYRVVFIFGIIITLFTTNIIPWLLLEHSVLKIIQFPWRFLGIASLMLSIIAGKEFIVLYNTNNIIRDKYCILTAMFALIFIPWFSGIQTFKLQPEARTIIYRYDNQNLGGPLFLDQYSPAVSQSKLGDNVNHVGLVNKNKTKFDVISNINGLTLTAQGIRGTKVTLPIFNYKNIYVYDGAQKIKHTTDKYARIVVHNPKTNKLMVRFIPSFLDYVAIIISITTWIVCFAIYMFHKLKLL